MKTSRTLCALILGLLASAAFSAPPPPMKGQSLFDGKTFKGWEGNLDWFRVEAGAIVGGTFEKRIPKNEFLTYEKPFENFQLRLKVRLVKNKGNAGIQIRSHRVPKHHEMIGYQADVARAYWGGLYDESRRRKFLAKPTQEEIDRVVKIDQWNDYVIRCEGPRVRLWINGELTADYRETDPKIKPSGLIGLQIHSGPPSEVWYKDIEIDVLPK